MKALVCGGRNFSDVNLLENTLDDFGEITSIIEGGARGADTLARLWAKKRQIPCQTVYAKWAAHGKGAGHIRNTEMLKLKPDVVIAFEGGAGTANMIKQASKAGVKTYPIGEIQ